jgi:hypothetical protein
VRVEPGVLVEVPACVPPVPCAPGTGVNGWFLASLRVAWPSPEVLDVRSLETLGGGPGCLCLIPSPC